MFDSPRFLPLALAVLLGVGLFASAANADDGNSSDEEKHISGMSILGNDESPKSLVIVPWKSSDLGDDLDLTRRFGQDRSALDPEVFRRSLDYHDIRTGHEAR
ncbi:MAG: hypothetical protein NXI30_20490 [bacterium]|nr:hypothetical protein [bacterium]